MIARTFFTILVSATFFRCHSDQDTDLILPEPEPDPTVLPVTIVNADTTDLPPHYGMDHDQRLDGDFKFEAGYFVDESTYAFTLEPNFYMASYQGDVIQQSRVYSQLMCVLSHNECDSEERMASLWDRVGRLPAADTLGWEYINDTQDHQYRFVMTKLPQPIRAIQVPSVLSADEDYTILYEKGSPKDSLLLELVIVSKTELTRERDIPFVNHSRTFFANLQHQTGQVTVLSEELSSTLESIWFSVEEDTVFWNVASIRKVIKTVDDKNVQITYQRNHFVPVTVE